VAGRLIAAGGVVLGAAVVVGTALYVRGAGPAFPFNGWAFQAMLGLCLVYALLFGRATPRE
jgi:hypothetical protein